ncbi:hypothetical protein [Streptomyces sp. NPDC017448]|uniref:hypothetical protein n=1 Tax=Streptomyces sp. NPDC017448 TaxID=3364996 RepID=UPI00379F2EFB
MPVASVAVRTPVYAPAFDVAAASDDAAAKASGSVENANSCDLSKATPIAVTTTEATVTATSPPSAAPRSGAGGPAVKDVWESGPNSAVP